jgi:hypothetical protein
MAFELAPLRAWNDFLGGGARFQLPNFQDSEKTTKRIVNNLLYYQSNYMLIYGILFCTVGFTNLQQFLLGFMSAATVTGVCVLLANSTSPYTRSIRAFFFRDHPYVALALLIGAIYVLFHMIGGLLLFALGVMLPVCLIILHACLRLRNVRNKISTKMELVGVKHTMMGFMLERLGVHITEQLLTF